MLVPYLFGCGDVSNDIFTEDGDFLSAFPDEAGQSVGFEQDTLQPSARAAIGDRADLVELSVAIGSEVNTFVFTLLGAVDQLRELQPAERTGDSRRWGPYDWECGVSLSARMTRDVGVFDWSFSGHTAGDDEATVFYGRHYAGDTIEGGDGSFVWDHSRYAGWCDIDEAGTLTAEYDNRDGIDLVVWITGYSQGGAAVPDRAYAYSRTDQAGDFQFRTQTDLDWDESRELASVTVRDRWVPGSGGRSDAVVTGGGLGDSELVWSQCWDAGGFLTYSGDNLGLLEQLGDPATCMFADEGHLDRI